VVEARGADRRSLSSLRLVASADGGRSARGSSFSLRETAPGRYEGFAPLSGKGLFGIDVLDPVSGSRASTWAWQSAGGESAAGGPDLSALSLIASASGGSLVPAEGILPPRASVHWSSLDLSLPLLVLAALLLVGDLFLRSTMAGQLGRAAAAVAAWWAAQRSLLESARGAPPAEEDRAARELREKRYAEMQIKLAEHVARRSERYAAAVEAEARGADADEEKNA
jgi:hypothetical protein